MYWNPVKTEREDGQCHASLVLSFPNGFKAQNERQTNKNNDDSRPQESILFSALSGLKDGVRLTFMLTLILAATAFGVRSVSAQTAPVLTITSLATNQISIAITNAIPADSYEVWWTPELGNTAAYPGSAAAGGNIGQSNFILNMNGLQTGFFYGLLDTNAVPLWEEADPGTPGSPILKVTIVSPANGSTLN